MRSSRNPTKYRCTLTTDSTASFAPTYRRTLVTGSSASFPRKNQLCKSGIWPAQIHSPSDGPVSPQELLHPSAKPLARGRTQLSAPLKKVQSQPGLVASTEKPIHRVNPTIAINSATDDNCQTVTTVFVNQYQIDRYLGRSVDLLGSTSFNT